jgi:GH24 family phage-related lysozyme (muramidase)
MISLEKLKDHLIQKEGLKLEAYKLPGELNYTIGVGHHGADVKKGMKITEEEAEQLLEKDIQSKLELIERKLPNFSEYSENLQKFVVDGFFRGDLSGSPKTLKLLNEGNFEEAAQEFLRNEEYNEAVVSGSGVASRMEDISEAIRNESNKDNLEAATMPTMETKRDDGREAATMPTMETKRDDGREAVPMPKEKPKMDDTQKMLIDEESPGKFRDMPPQAEPEDRTLVPSEEEIDNAPTGDNIFSSFFSSISNLFDSDDDEGDTPIPQEKPQTLKKGGAVEADFDGKDNDDEDEDEGDPPPLAKPEEVADDIPAMLSEGEYVLPANVVRYLGLERIMDMHQRVLHEIQQMEDLGMIQNVDENGKPENDDDEMKFIQPEGKVTETVIIAAKPQGMMCPPKMAEGGEVNRNIDIDRTLDDDALKIRADIANQRNPVGFETVFDPEVGVVKIKTPKGNVSVDKGLVGGFKTLETGPEGADPADPDVGGTAESFDVISQSIKDIISETIGGPGTQSDLDDRSMTVGYDVSREVDPGDEDDSAVGGYDTSEDDAEDDGGDTTGGAELRSGGLMAKFNTGGGVDYNIAGVGTVSGDVQMGDQSEEMEKPKTYEEIREDILGDPFKDMPNMAEDFGDIRSENYFYKGNPMLEGPKLQTRKKKSSYVYDPTEGMDTGYRTDKELKTILDQTGIDSEEYFRIMDNYDKGKTDIMADVAGGTVAKSEKLKSAIDALADKRRILKEGLKPSDIPEGATNRDVIKKVFFNEIDNFGEEVDPSNFQQSDQIQTVVNADLDKLATSDQKKDQDALAFLNQFELDAPADASVVNSGLNILSGKPARASRQESRSGIMGQGQYVEGVGYVT